MYLVPVRSVGSTRISVLYWGAPGCSIANVSSRCASKLGGSAATTKTSSPPDRGLSWAVTGVAISRKDSSIRNGRMAERIMRGLPVGEVPVQYHEPPGGCDGRRSPDGVLQLRLERCVR